MSASKYVIGGIVIIAACVSIVPLFKKDFYQNSLFSHEKSSSVVSSSSDEIGIFNGITLKKSDLTTQELQSIFTAESQLYKAEETILSQRYFQTVIEKYAKDHNISDKNSAQEQFLQDNIKLTDSDVDQFIQKNSDNPQLKGKSKADQVALVKPYLLQQAAGIFFQETVSNAKRQGLLKVTGSTLPEAPKVKIDIANAPTKGPKSAPITIVEFADYQCPYCYTAQATVNSIMKKYQNKIQFVFKSYPLAQIHPQAINASIAADCAGKQGKYWEMHDVLFENHSKLEDALYEKLAKSLNLDLSQFHKCYLSPEARNNVMNDMNYGQSLGINATPAFYINGILLMGAQPESEFISVIEAELNK